MVAGVIALKSYEELQIQKAVVLLVEYLLDVERKVRLPVIGDLSPQRLDILLFDVSAPTT